MVKLFVFKTDYYGGNSYAIIAKDLDQAKALIIKQLNEVFSEDNSDFYLHTILETVDAYKMVIIQDINLK